MLKKKDDLDRSGPAEAETVRRLAGPEFTFIRSDTVSQHVIIPPDGGHGSFDDGLLSPTSPSRDQSRTRRSLDVFRSTRSRSASVSSTTSHQSRKDGAGRRLSQRLHLSRQPDSSENVPENLPEIVIPVDSQDKDGAELQWEKRATILAEQNERARSRPATPNLADSVSHLSLDGPSRRSRSPSASSGIVSSKAIDADIQEAIRLHEEGDLEGSTRIFGRLADPRGANNPLSQVLYGLALR